MPIKIYCQSSHLKIVYENTSTGDKLKSEKILTSKFSARDKSMSHNPLVKKGIISDIKSFYNTDYNILPAGFLSFLEHYYTEAKLDYEIVEMRKFPSVDKEFLKSALQGNIKFGELIPKDYQAHAVYTVAKERGGIVSLPTSSGKTLIMAMFLKTYSKSRMLVLFNTIDLIEQTYNDLLSYGFKPNEIGVIQGNNFDDTKKITLLSVQSYEKAFHLFTGISVIICDEVHETGRTDLAEKIIYSCQNAPIRIGLSATPWSDNPYETMRLYGNIGPVVFEKEITEQIEQDHIAKTIVELYRYDCDPIRAKGIYADIYDTKKIGTTHKEDVMIANGYEIVTVKGVKYARKFLEFGDEYTHFVNNEARNNKIIDVIKYYVKQNKRILVIFNRIDHGEILKAMYPDGILIHGQHDIRDRNAAKDLIKNQPGTVVFASNIWHKGINLTTLDVLINVSGGHSSVRVVQKLGRVVRKSKTTYKPFAIACDFDDSHLSGIGRNQTKKRLNVYEKILKLPVKIIN